MKPEYSQHCPVTGQETKRIKGFSISSQIHRSSFPFTPAKNHLSQHTNHLIIPNRLFHCTLKSGVPLTKRTLACLPGFSQFIPTSLVLCDAPFPSRIPPAPSCRSLICHLLGYYLEGCCTCCSSLKRLLAETLQLTLDTLSRHAGASSNLCFLTQILFCSSSTQSSPDSSYPPFPILLVNLCCLWTTLE